jgi:alpha-D-xyloside xylohydrolase
VKKVLTINERKGSFPAMLNERKFSIVWVSKNKGVGMDPVAVYDSVVAYSGKKVVVSP